MILEHGTWANSMKKIGHEQPFGFLDYSSWKKWCTRKCLVWSPLTNQIHWNRMLVWTTRWELLNSWAPPTLVPKGANHNRLATFHLEYVNCLIFLATYVKEFIYNHKLWQHITERLMWAQRTFYMNIKKNSHFYKNKHLQCSCIVCIGVANIDWYQHPYISSQHNKKISTCHFDILSHIVIFQLYGSWVYVLMSMSAWCS